MEEALLTPVLATDPLKTCVDQILAKSDFPGCSAHIQTLLALAAQPDTSGAELTNIILKDVALTLHVLRTANSALYNRSGRPILSVAHAVTLLGIERVALIASGIKLLQHFAPREPGVRELVTLSLLTAAQGRHIADSVGYPRLEEAYLCGLLRNFGEILTAYYLPRKYADILVRLATEPLHERRICRTTLGFTYEDLAAEVLEQWGITGRVVACLLTHTESLGAQPPSEDKTLRIITTFSHLATNTVFRGDDGKQRQNLRKLIDRWGSRLALSEVKVNEILRQSIADAGDSFRALGLSIDRLKLHNQVEHAMQLLQEEPPPEAPDEPRFDSALSRVERELLVALQAPGDLDLTRRIESALEAIAGSQSFRRAIFALLDETKTRLVGKLGRGADVEPALNLFAFQISLRNAPIGAAMAMKQDFLIDLDRDARFYDSQLVATLKPGVFAVYPIVIETTAIGCLYCDRPDPGGATSPSELSQMTHIRDLIGQAIDRKRSR